MNNLKGWIQGNPCCLNFGAQDAAAKENREACLQKCEDTAECKSVTYKKEGSNSACWGRTDASATNQQTTTNGNDRLYVKRPRY